MRLVKAFLFAAVAAAVVAVPSHESQAFLMEGAGVAPLKMWPGPYLIESIGGLGPDVPVEPATITYTTKPGDKLRTPDRKGVLDRFGVSIYALREANPHALVPVCIGAFLNPNGLVTCRELNWYLREGVNLTIPRQQECGGREVGITF